MHTPRHSLNPALLERTAPVIPTTAARDNGESH